jgi:hypothetical protein
LWEATSDYADKEQKQGRSNGSDDNFADDPSANMNAQPRKQPTADKASYDADANETKAAAGHQFSCQPSRSVGSNGELARRVRFWKTTMLRT